MKKSQSTFLTVEINQVLTINEVQFLESILQEALKMEKRKNPKIRYQIALSNMEFKQSRFFNE